MATIEERVARLEAIEENRNLDAALAAHAFGINLVQTEVVAIRADLARLESKVDANHAEINGKLDAILARLDRG
jgi:hypothetical protein